MNKAMSGKDLLDMVEVLAHEKSVDIDVVFGVVEVALATAIKRSRARMRMWWCISTAKRATIPLSAAG